MGMDRQLPSLLLEHLCLQLPSASSWEGRGGNHIPLPVALSYFARLHKRAGNQSESTFALILTG